MYLQIIYDYKWWQMQAQALSKPYGSRDSDVRKRCGKMREDIGKQKGRGFNLCVAPSPRNQVSRISDGAEKDLE